MIGKKKKKHKTNIEINLLAGCAIPSYQVQKSIQFIFCKGTPLDAKNKVLTLHGGSQEVNVRCALSVGAGCISGGTLLVY